MTRPKAASDADRTAAERRLSGRIVLYIRDVIARRGLSRTAARKLLGLGPKAYADLMEGDPKKVDPEPLYRHLVNLGVNVGIFVSRTPDWRPGRTTLVIPKRPRRPRAESRKAW